MNDTLQIEVVHLGLYRVRIINDGQITATYEGGSALVMQMLTRLIFDPEAAQYNIDRRASSDALGREAIQRMQNDPTLNPTGRKLLKDWPK